MDEVLRMYAMSPDNNEPAEMNPEHDEGMEEDEGGCARYQ